MLGGSFSNHKSMRVCEVVSDSSPEMWTTRATNVVRLACLLLSVRARQRETAALMTMAIPYKSAPES